MAATDGDGDPGSRPPERGESLISRLISPSDRLTGLAVAALVLLGGLLRLAWAVKGHATPINSEAFFIARALAEGRGFAEAFGLDTGPTAHLMLLTPLPAALVYSLFGVGTPMSELVLSAWAVACVCGSIYLAERVLRELGASNLSRIVGVAVAALAPIQLGLEVTALRVWETGVATVLLLAILLLILRLDRLERASWRDLLAVGFLNALAFLVSPAVAIATSGVIGLWFLRRVPPLRWPIPIVTAMAVVVLVLVPWGLRNEAKLGEFKPIRTGEGISMALAYHDGRLHAADIQKDDLRRFREVSPLMGPAARAHYKAVGEIAYNDELSAQAQAWRAQHPDEVWTIRARNLVQFFAPPAWLWTRFTATSSTTAIPRAVFVGVLSSIALATLAGRLLARRWRWTYAAAAVLLPALPYVATYPLLRYRYVVSTLLILIACHGLVALADYLRRRGRKA